MIEDYETRNTCNGLQQDAAGCYSLYTSSSFYIAPYTSCDSPDDQLLDSETGLCKKRRNWVSESVCPTGYSAINGNDKFCWKR